MFYLTQGMLLLKCNLNEATIKSLRHLGSNEQVYDIMIKQNKKKKIPWEMGPGYDYVTTRFLYRNNNSICLPCPELMCMYGCACVQAGATGRHIGA